MLIDMLKNPLCTPLFNVALFVKIYIHFTMIKYIINISALCNYKNNLNSKIYMKFTKRMPFISVDLI